MNAKHRDLKRASALLLAFLALWPGIAVSATYFSVSDGTWNSAGRWRSGVGASCAGGTLSTALVYPGSAASGATDVVIICTGDDITLPLSPANGIVSLETQGTGTLASSTTNVTLTVNGDVTNAGTISFNGASGSFTLDVNGSVTNTGTISISANDRTHTFNVSGDITGNGGMDLRNGSDARIANLTLDGAGTQTLSGTGTIELFTITAAAAGHEFEVNKAGGSLAIGDNISLANDFTITAGTVSFSGAGGAQTIDIGGDIDNAGTLTLSGGNAHQITVDGDFTNTGTVNIANSTVTHVLNLAGNLANAGTFDMALDTNSLCRVNFIGANPTVSGAGTTEFNVIGVDLTGGTIANVVNVTAIITMSGNNSAFAFTDGTFRLSSASSITPATAITIPANARLELNDAGAVVTTTATLIINGGVLSITNVGGDMNVGNAANENVQINDISTSELRIAGGTLDVAGRVASAVATGGQGVFSMSGGAITVGINGNTLNAQNGAPFALGSATTFTQSGGTIVIQASNTQVNAREYDVQSATSTVTGGTLQMGNAATGAATTFQINSAAPVYNLTLNATNTPTTTLFAALNVNNDLTIGAGTTLNLSANQAINMGNGTAGGDWINNGGTFTPGTGTVTFNGTGAQAIGGTGATNFATLIDANTGAILSVNFNINVATALTVNTSAQFQPAAAVVINNAAAAGTISGSGTIYVTRVAATADYVNQYKFTTNTLSALTVNYSGAGAQSVNIFTYGSLIASTSGTKTLAGNVTISSSGNLNVNTSGVILELGTFTANCSGTGTATIVAGATLRIGGTNGFPSGYSTTSLAATSTVEYYGAGQNVLGQTYGHLTLSGSGTKTLVTANATIGGNLSVNATNVTFDLQNFTADRSPAGGTLAVVGGSTLKIGTTGGTNGFPAGYTTVTLAATSTVEYAGANQNVLGRNYGHLTLSGTGTKTLVTANAVMAGNLSVNASGVTFDLQNFTANGPGAATLLVVSGATLKIGTTGGTTGFPTGYGTVTLQSTSTVEYAGDAQTVANQTYSNLTLSGNGAKTLNAGMTSIGNVFTITAGATANAVVGLTVNGNFVLSTTTASAFNAGNFTHQLKANFTDTSSPAGFNGSTGTVHLNGTLAQTIGGATNTVFNNLQITNAAGASLTGGVTKTVNGTLTLSSGTFAVGGNTLVLNGPAIAGTPANLSTTSASNLTFGGTSTPLTVPTVVTALNNLTVTKTVGTLSLGANLAISGDLSVTGSGGTLDLSSFTANRASAGGTLTVSDGATLRIGGTSTTFPTNYSTVSLGGTSTVVYYGAGQTIGNYNYGNLTLSGSGTNTSGGTTTVAGTLQIGNGVIYDLGSNSLSGSGGSATISVANGGTLRIGGTNGFPSGFSGTPSLGATSTVEYYGSNQNVRGLAYGHLTLSGTATKTLVTANATIAGNLTLNTSGVTFDLDTFTCNGTGGSATIVVGNGSTLRIGGTNTFPSGYATTTINGGSTVNYGGTTQNVTNLAYGNLTISGSGTKTVTGGDASVSATLNLSAGILATGANQLTIGTAGSVSRGGGCGGTSCFVAGNFTKNVPAGTPTVSWETGSITPSPAYAPVSIAFTGAAAGNFRVTSLAAAADHADVTAELAGIDPALSVNRYWTFTRLTGSATSYAPTFTYGNVGSDLDPGTTPANFIVAQKSTGFWEYPTLSGTPTGTSATVTGVIDANGDDFVVGEPKLTTAPMARWLMDQTSWNGTANEVLDTAGGYHGTAAGITTRPNTDASTPPIPGNPGTCQYGVFSRANKDYIALPTFPNVNTAAGAFTITAWIRSTNVGDSGQRIMVDDQGNANGNWGFSLGDGGAGQLRFFYRQGTVFILDTAGTPLANNTWYFVAVAMRLKAGGNSSKGEIFVFNTAGALHSTAKANFTVTSFATDTTPASIGGETNASGENTNAFGFGGSLDMVSVFNTDLSRQHVNLVRQTTAPCVFLDHIRLTHDGIGLTCAPETVTITACSDPACSLQYTGNVDTTLSPTGWVGGDAISFTGGSTTRDLRHTTPGIVTLGASSTTPTPSGSARCFIGVTETCSMEFKDSGFVFDVPSQTACKTSPTAITISAVRTDLTTQTCAPAFSGPRTVNFWSTYVSPGSGSSAVSVSGTPVSGSNPGTGVNLNFNASAEATFTVNYPDAGQVQLNARYDGAGTETGLVMTGNDQFVSSPVGLAAYGASSCPAGDATCPVFGKAGAAFNLNVKAACWTADGDTDLSDNPVTPNFALAGIPVSHTLVAPALGVSGSIGATSFNFSTGDAGLHVLSQSVTEVGVFTFTVTPPNYLGLPLAAATSPNIGRFTPARLNVTANTPEFAHSCDGAAGDFTYMDQPFHYGIAPMLTVTGLNQAGNTTQNYGGEGTGGSDFWRMASTLSGRSYADPGHTGSFGANNTGDATLGDAADYNGQGTLTLVNGTGGDEFMYTRGASPEAPFDAEVDLTFTNATLTDSDNICYDPDNDGCEGSDTFKIDDITATGTEQQRFGRLVIGTAAGSELLPLAVRMEAEYFNGTGFVLNTDDTASCSAIATADVDTSGTGCAAGTSTPAVAHNPLLGGQAGLTLSAPGEACTGDIGIAVDLSTGTGVDLEWLRYDWDGDGAQDNDPAGRASFGVYGGSENLIYIREPWN